MTPFDPANIPRECFGGVVGSEVSCGAIDADSFLRRPQGAGVSLRALAGGVAEVAEVKRFRCDGIYIFRRVQLVFNE